jgi:molybdopterin molybdotransferase
MLRNIDADEALDMLCALPVRLELETIPLDDAHGRILARELRAPISVPPFDKSPYDGYAFRGEDTLSASQERPVTLKITEEIPAGKAPAVEITTGYAAKILTGAPIPTGANATIKYEQTVYTDSEVTLFEPVPPDTDIVYAGSDIRAGTVVFEKGVRITAPMLGVLASQGYDKVSVFKSPRS